jgi:ornithine carbamoyltransferase
MNLTKITTLSATEINEIFSIADAIKSGRQKAKMENKVLALLFEKPSTRTRVSFEAAMARLGGSSIYIDKNTSQLSRGETIGDTAMVLSQYVDFIAARMYKQKDLEDLAASATVPVINALTDTEHPCQAISDIYTMREKSDTLKGKKLAFVGDIAANTANSLLVGCTAMGMDVVLVGPESCKPNAEYLSRAKKSGRVEVTADMHHGIKDADFIYTDTFVSMGQEGEAEKRRAEFKEFQLNASALSHAKKTAFVMHCLPAHRGEEITSEVLDGKMSIVALQARNKMIVEGAILIYLSSK